MRNPIRPLWSENAGYPQIRRVMQTYPQNNIERSSPIEAVAIGQNPHDRSHPPPQLRETSISCQLGPGRTQITAAPKSQIVGIPPFSYCAIDARTTADTSFETPTGRYRYISQLGTPHTSIVSAHKSRIVGIPPFPNPVKEEEQNDTHPLPTPTHEKQAYLPVVYERG